MDDGEVRDGLGNSLFGKFGINFIANETVVIWLEDENGNPVSTDEFTVAAPFNSLTGFNVKEI